MKKIWIKNLSTKKKNQIKKILQEGNFLPFYTKTGTSVFTSRVPRDFESLWYKEDEMKNYLSQFHKLKRNKMKRKYGLIIGGGRPIYFDTIKERVKIIRGIKNAVTYHTFHKDVKK